MNSVSFGIMIPILPNLIKQFDRRRHGLGVGVERALRHRLGLDAVRVRPDPRHAVGPLRPPAGAADLDLRPVRRLPVHGLRAEPGLAVPRPRAERRDSLELLDRQRLCRRHHPAGAARTQLRNDGFGLRLRLHHRPDDRRPAGRDQPAAAVHRRPPGFACSTGSTACWCCPSPCPPSAVRWRIDWRRANPLGALAFLRERRNLARPGNGRVSLPALLHGAADASSCSTPAIATTGRRPSSV